MKNKTLFLAWLIVGVMLSIGLPVLAAPPYDGGAGDGFSVAVTTYQFTGDAVSIESSADQTPLGRGALPTEASMITIKQASSTGITAAKDIRIRIPPELKLVWDTSITTASIYNIKNEYSSLSATRAKVATTQPSPNNTTVMVTYADAGKTLLIDVTTDFDMGDTLRIRGLRFMNFDAYSSGKLKLDILGSVSGYQYLDLRYKTIAEPYIYGDGWASEESQARILATPKITVSANPCLVGTTKSISWTTAGFNGTKLKLEYATYLDNFTTYSALLTIPENAAADLDVSLESFDWLVPSSFVPKKGVRVRFVDKSNADIKDVSPEFHIIGALALTAPPIFGSGVSTVWPVDSQKNITWTTTGLINPVKLEYSVNDGAFIQVNGTQSGLVSPNNNLFPWQVLHTPYAKVQIKLSDANDDTVFSLSDPFIISGIKIISPNGQEEWEIGADHYISWESAGLTQPDIIVSYLLGTTPKSIFGAVNQGTNGQFGPWKPKTTDESSEVKAKVISSDGGCNDESDSTFRIVKKAEMAVTYPKDSDNAVMQIGAKYTITWSKAGTLYSTVDLFYLDNSGIWVPIGAGLPNSGSYEWTVPAVELAQTQIKIIEAGRPKVGNPPVDRDMNGRETTEGKVQALSGIFSITQPVITVTAPKVSDIWVYRDTSRDITWEFSGTITTPLTIEYTVDVDNPSGAVWLPEASDEANDKIYRWSVPSGINSKKCQIRITDSTNIRGYSDIFEINENPTIKITHPAIDTEKLLTLGDPYTIKWDITGQISSHYVSIEYSTDDFQTKVYSISPSVSNSGSFPWSNVGITDTEENIISNNVKIRIKDKATGYSMVMDDSDAFEIAAPKLELQYPIGAELLYATGTYNISWSKVGLVQNLVFEYSLNNGTSWEVFTPGAITTTDNKNYTCSWTLPNVTSDQNQCLVRIADSDRTTTITQSPQPFKILVPKITVLEPNLASVSVKPNTLYTIRWDWEPKDGSGAVHDQIKIEYSTDAAHATWKPCRSMSGSLATGLTNSGTFEWKVPDEVSATVKIRITDGSRTETTDTSDADFKIISPTVQITTPVAGERLVAGLTYPIAWQSEGLVEGTDLLDLSYYSASQNKYISIQSGLAPAGTLNWKVPQDAISDSCKIKIIDNVRSDKPQHEVIIRAVAATVDFVQPKDTTVWTVADALTITWNIIGELAGDLQVAYLSEESGYLQSVPFTTVTNTATSCPWTPQVNPGRYKIRVTDTGNDNFMDSQAFEIKPIPEITITAPSAPDNKNWIVGTTHDITWTDNGGVISNNLKLEYNTYDASLPDYDTHWQVVVPGGVYVRNSHTYSWVVPDAVSATVKIRITDMDRQSTKALSPGYFEIAPPVIELESPKGGEIWATNDPAPIKWKNTGSVSSNLNFYYIPADNIPRFIDPTDIVRVEGANTVFWKTTDFTGKLKFKVVDASRPVGQTEIVSNEFTVISAPIITMQSPGVSTGEVYVLGKTLPISWVTQGLTLGKLKIEYSADEFQTFYPVVENIDGVMVKSFDWSVPLSALSSPNIKIRITSDNVRIAPAISANAFRLRGGFDVIAPQANATLGAKFPFTIQWNTIGTILNVNIDYYFKKADGSWERQTPAIASNIPNTGSYSPWILPDKQNTPCMVRISDVNDPTVYTDVEFNIAYYTINWRVLDYDTYTDISTLNVKDALWNAAGLDSPIGTVYKYPYGTYTTFWSRDLDPKYPEKSSTWVADANKTVTVYLESAISQQLEWHVLLSSSYTVETDSLKASCWLERRGKMIGLIGEEQTSLREAILQIYDGDVFVKELRSNTPDSKGVFSFVWDNTGLEAGKTYFVKAQITYREGVYTSGGNIDVTAAKAQQAAKEELSAQLGVATMDIKSAVGDVKTAVETKAEEVKAQVAAVKAETGQILTATGTTLPAQITAVQEAVVKEIKPSVQSGILNRETSVKIGSSMTVSYRTTTGLAPVISVYDPKNVLKVASRTMKEIGTTGVYEYDLKFENSWGIGDFTIICSESTQGTADALAISVVRHDLEEVSGQVSGILGTTSSLTGLGDIVDTLNSQFGLIEKALGNLGQGISGEVSKTKGVVNDLESVYNQLTSLSGQIKKIGGTQGVSLEKLYKVSKDKKDDITYLKNKAQELKATMEINQKMMQNVANKPVVQSWFEFK